VQNKFVVRDHHHHVPFTPFHIGPTLLLGLLLFSQLDLAALLIGGVAPDLEGLYSILTDSPGMDHHEFLHSYLGSTLLALILSPAIYLARGLTGRLAKTFGICQESSIRVILASCMLGAWSHVLLDSFLYMDQDPFLPLNGNPFYPLMGDPRFILIYAGCSLSFFIGLILLVWRPGRFGNSGDG